MQQPQTVMAGLDPWAFSPRTGFMGIHARDTVRIAPEKGVDHRVEPGVDNQLSVPHRPVADLPWTKLSIPFKPSLRTQRSNPGPLNTHRVEIAPSREAQLAMTSSDPASFSLDFKYSNPLHRFCNPTLVSITRLSADGARR
jgi:hypothetical protein